MPLYISYGLTKEYVLDETPKGLKPYKKAYELRIKEQDKLNYYLGQYFCTALSLFGGGKYMEKPILHDYGLSEQELIDRALLEMAEREDREYLNWKLVHDE